MLRARVLARVGEARSGAPRVVHVSVLGGDEPGRRAIVLALDTIARELEPLAVTFFRVGDDGEIASSVVHASHLPPAEVARQVRTWKATLRGCDPLAPRRLPAPPGRIATMRGDDGAAARVLTPRMQDVYRHLGVVNDARLLIRNRERVVAGVTLWRRWSSRPWSSAQLRQLRALQPLVEMAYLALLAETTDVDAQLPATLTRRERQVARVLASGVTNDELARALHVSPNTAKTHTRATLTKLGLSSRRELVRRFAHEPSPVAGATSAASLRRHGGATDLLRPARREPGDPLLWIEGTTTTHQLLLAPILGWAAERLGAAVGGCAVLSARRTLVAEACGTARPSAHRLDRRLVHELRRSVVSGPIAARLAAAPAPPSVAPLDAFATAPERERLTELLARLDLAMPLVTVLSPLGRVAALAWIAQDARTADAHDAIRELRGLHPLLALAYAPQVEACRPRTPAAADLGELGLTPRQLTVARLALAGAGNDEIARTLKIAESTVKNHMTQVLAACGVRSRMQLIAAFGAAGDDGTGQNRPL